MRRYIVDNVNKKEKEKKTNNYENVEKVIF